MRLYLDANVLIRAVESDDAVARRLDEIFDHAENRDCEIVTSELSLAETSVIPLQKLADDPNNPEAIERERLFRSFAEPDSVIGMLPVSRTILFQAAALRASRPSIKLPDALHLATYIVSESDVFVSGDKRLLSAALSCAGRGSTCALDEPELSALLYRITG